jgi:hypothetical protein
VAKHFTIGPLHDVAEANAWVLPNTQRGLPAAPYGAFKGKISVCGNGPSLREQFPQRGLIAALNGSWKALAKHGVTPDFIVAFDPSPQNVAWFDDAPNTTYLLASSVHPAVFEKLAGKDVRQWHGYGAAEAGLGLGPLIGGGFSVGCLSLNLLHHIGFTHFDCYGYDSCYSMDGRHHATSQDWNITAPEAFQVGEHMFIAEPWMAAQVQEFLEQIEANRRNYTVDVKGDGYLATALEWNTLPVLYDLDVAPGSFDFMCSMLNVENFRAEHGYSRVKVHFKAGSDKGFRPNDVIDIGHEQKNRMLNHVVRPLLQMFGFEETGASPGDAAFQFDYSPRPSVDHFRETGKLPVYVASAKAQAWAEKNFSDEPYVITLRETYYWPQRNSNVQEWAKFARSLDRRVVFVRDTYRHDEPLEDFETCPAASLDLHKRLALYRKARMNFFVTNGPGGLAWYSRDIPYINFYTDAPGYHCYDPRWMQEYIGLEPYGQFPWADPTRQRLVYANDTFENITAAFNELRNQ